MTKSMQSSSSTLESNVIKSVKFCPLASGSKGNCLYLAYGDTKVLIDAGISRKATVEKLAQIGVSLDEIDAILITHDHTDHIAGLKMLAYQNQIPVLANAETAKGIISLYGNEARFKIFTTGESFSFGDLEITPFSVPHDTVDPVMFAIKTPEHKFGICSDLGFATSLVKAHLKDCDYLYLESNHEPDWVMACSRPQTYKTRVLSRTGHLSNTQCAELLKDVASNQLKQVFLAHLSSECNAHEKALEVVSTILGNAGIQLPLTVAPQAQIGLAI